MSHPRYKTLLPLLLVAVVLTLAVSTPLFSKLAAVGQNLFQKIQIMTTVLTTIDRQYYKEVDEELLIEGAIKGLLSSLDPHTVYMTKDDFEKWQTDFQGYYGIGISFDIIQNKITVLSVNEYGPASRVGLQPGDRIVTIDDETAIGIKRAEVPLKLMGPNGSSVKIGVERHGWDRPREFTITRRQVATPSVPFAFMLDETTGYIKIARFTGSTVRDFDEAAVDLRAAGMRQLILDLRGNQGGYLSAAEGIADRFIPHGKVLVFTKGRIDAYAQETVSTDATLTPLPPLIVLIDHVSASGSEIVAGAVQDWDRGLIVGQTSFGKGLVQRQFPFADGSALMATIAAYYTPSGRLIQRDYSRRSRLDYFLDPFSDEPADTTVEGPVHHTSLGRTVYGGGGITPDVLVKPTPGLFTPALRRLYFAEEKFFYLFCEQYANAHPEIGENLDAFINSFSVSPQMYREFVSRVRDCGFKFSEQEFAQNEEGIKFTLQYELAFILWGDLGRHRVTLSRDAQFAEALGRFNDARRLLEQKDFSLRQLNR